MTHVQTDVNNWNNDPKGTEFGYKSLKRCSSTNCCSTLRKFSHGFFFSNFLLLFIQFMVLKWWWFLSFPYSVIIHMLCQYFTICNSTFFHESVHFNYSTLSLYKYKYNIYIYILNETMPERNSSYHFCDVSLFSALNSTAIFYYKNTFEFPCHWFWSFLSWKY